MVTLQYTRLRIGAALSRMFHLIYPESAHSNYRWADAGAVRLNLRPWGLLTDPAGAILSDVVQEANVAFKLALDGLVDKDLEFLTTNETNGHRPPLLGELPLAFPPRGRPRLPDLGHPTDLVPQDSCQHI